IYISSFFPYTTLFRSYLWRTRSWSDHPQPQLRPDLVALGLPFDPLPPKGGYGSEHAPSPARGRRTHDHVQEPLQPRNLADRCARSEEHTSELQSRENL